MAERIVSPGVFTREKDLSFLPQAIGEIGAAIIGTIFFIIALQVITHSSKKNARRLMLASIIYLPILLVLILLERILI